MLDVTHRDGAPCPLARPATQYPLFKGFFLGGFECSCHVISKGGRRLDLHASTRHLQFVDADYQRLANLGMTACRDGVSWVRAARRGDTYDFSFVAPMLRAAQRHGLDVVWDLMHFGWPDNVDPFAASFPSRFARYARAFATWLTSETDRAVMLSPINEMSFLSWAGGDVRYMNPFEEGRGVELKVQLVRATIEAIEAIRSVDKGARFLAADPIIYGVPRSDDPAERAAAEALSRSQYQAWDMLTGRAWPSIGGQAHYLDVVGVNFYPHNQFTVDRKTVFQGETGYRPLSSMLLEVWERYRRPMIISETGTEGDARASWFAYVADECERAIEQGCELHGVTLYPVLNHPGWLDDRHCHNGLWDYADSHGNREVHAPLEREIARQRGRLEAARARMLQVAHPTLARAS
ncbi:MAG: hypothetical protein FWD73_03580 [Polyangiaceae bacterium]|nr:hypothetical protein [Polyangiaceae bacterium]